MTSGGSRSINFTASRPSATLTTRMSSFSNESVTTRAKVALLSASKRVGSFTALDHFRPRLDVLIDEVHDVLHRAAGQENAGDPHVLQLWNVDIGNDAADQHTDVLEAFALQQRHQP